MTNAAATLEVEDLQTWFHGARGPTRAVDGVSFKLLPGKVLGLVGESGSGKSITGLSIMGLVEPPGQVVGGRMAFKGRDLLAMGPEERRRLRGDRIAMVFQDPMMTLNPVLRIDTQMLEAVLAHRKVPRSVARERALAALQRVGIAAPEQRLACYPHQLSGGMRQRVAIAIALLNEPELIIADEPTTALDVTVQGQILAEMQKICEGSGTALIWITHDLSVVAGLADEVGVMYAGRLVEHGSTAQILTRPMHPYTEGLVASVPTLQSRGTRLPQIRAADAPPAHDAGCGFRPRCDRATSHCAQDPLLLPRPDGRHLRCYHAPC
jgi:peptide/nickel transport system ATP-binding protein